MALTKEKKAEVVKELIGLLEDSKMTVLVKYQGTSVKELQEFRKLASSSETVAKIAKNRLMTKAIQQVSALKDLDTSSLGGMLMFVFNSGDEVVPAKIVADFAKTHPTLEFAGAISDTGKLLSVDEVKALAALPGREQLIAEVCATLLSPVMDATNALSGNLHNLLDGLATKAA